MTFHAATAPPRASLGLKAKAAGAKRPFYELKTGADFWRLGSKWVQRVMIVDHRSDRYFERVTDGDNVIHHCDEKLSEHRGHGSAKNPTKA
jgi:hypothetical protein